MKTPNRFIISAAVAGVVGLAGNSLAVSPVFAAKKEKCWGTTAAEKGACGGKDLYTGEEWSCAGQNTQPEWGWKKMTEEECKAAGFFDESTKKVYEAHGISTPPWSKKNPLYEDGVFQAEKVKKTKS